MTCTEKFRTVVTGPLPTTELLRTLIEVPRTEYLWGHSHLITPRLVTAVFGDGRHLVAIEPVMTRPEYYVVRVDSTVALESGSWREQLDDVLDELQEEYSSELCRCDKGMDREEGHSCYEHAGELLSGGVGWSAAYWPAEVVP